MECKKCGQPLEEGAKFCVHCGTPVLGGRETAAAVQPQAAGPVAGSSFDFKETSQNYLAFIKKALKSPFSFAKTAGSESLVPAIITMVLYAIFLPLMIYFNIKHVPALETFGVEVPFAPIFFRGFFYTALFIAAFGLIAFGTLKLTKTDVSFQSFIGRFGSFLAVPAALVVISAVCAIITLNVFSFIVLAVSSITFTAAMVMLMVSYQKESGSSLDSLYTSAIVFTVVYIVVYIVSKNAILGFIQNQIQNQMGTLFSPF